MTKRKIKQYHVYDWKENRVALLLFLLLLLKSTLISNPPHEHAIISNLYNEDPFLHLFKYMFLIFKKYYTYFHTFFYLYIFIKN